MNEERRSQLKEEVVHYYQQKYGKVSVTFEHFAPDGEYAAVLEVTISDALGFITRYYGSVCSQDGKLRFRTMSI